MAVVFMPDRKAAVRQWLRARWNVKSPLPSLDQIRDKIWPKQSGRAHVQNCGLGVIV